MTDKGWFVVDVLEGDPRLVGRDGQAKARTSLERALKERVGGRLSDAVQRWVLGEIELVRTTKIRYDTTRELMPGQSTRLILEPIIGPTEVHGVQLWIGPSTSEPQTSPATALAFDWDSTLRLVELPATLPDLFSADVVASDRRTFTAPEALRYMSVDDGLGLISRVLEPHAGSTWNGLARVRGSAGRTGVAHLVLAAQQDNQVWRGLLHDVSANSPLPRSLESAALAAMSQVALSTHIVLMDLSRMRLIQWITDPPTGIQWKGMVDNRDAPHPDDVKRIFEAVAEVFTGKTDRAEVANIRLRRFGGGWTVVNGSGAVIRHEGGPQLGLIEMKVIGESDEPDPVPATDPGHPGLTVDPGRTRGNTD